MKKKLTIPRRNMIIVISLLILLFAVSLTLFYQSEKKSITISKENAIKTIADFKIDQISAWYVDEVLDINIISKDEILSELIVNYLKTKNDRDKQHLIRFLYQMETEHLYSDVILLTPDEKILVSTNKKILVPDAIDIQILRTSFKENKGLNSDIFTSGYNGKVYLDFISTVNDSENKILAGLICRKDPNAFLNPLIKTWPTSGKTAETYLVKKTSSGDNFKYKPNQQYLSGGNCWQIVSKKDAPSLRAITVYSGFLYGKNEYDVDVCSYLSPIPNTPWSIVLMVNHAELLKDLHANMIKFSIIALLLILVCITGLAIFNKNRREKYLSNMLAKEIELRQYEERFNLTMDILGEGVCMFKAEDLLILMTNPRLDEMFGYERGELIGKNITILLSASESQKAEIAERFIPNFENKKLLNTEFLNVRKNGTEFWTIARVYLLTHEKFGPVWIGVLQDVTDRKNFEEKLIQSEASYKNLFENNPLPMMVYDNETLDFISVNNTAVAKYGYSQEEFLTMTLRDIIPDDELESFNNSYFQIRRDSQITRLCRHKLKNGEIRYFEIASHTINYNSKKARMVLSNDVTMNMKYEAELIEAKEKAEESERLKSAFLANMSHEIRTPLNGILGFSQLLNEENLDKEDIKKYSGYIVTGGNRLFELLSNILNISKIESGSEVLSLNEFAVNESIRDIYSQFLLQGKIKNISYTLNIPSESDAVLLTTDVVKLGQILTNFLSNSFKFTQDGFIELGYNYNEEEIEFFVKDSGIGIDPLKHDFVFERFYQADNSLSNGHEGTGLGLAICKGFSKLMNGEIRIESILGEGSTFYLTLPLNPNKKSVI